MLEAPELRVYGTEPQACCQVHKILRTRTQMELTLVGIRCVYRPHEGGVHSPLEVTRGIHIVLIWESLNFTRSGRKLKLKEKTELIQGGVESQGPKK